MYYQTRGRASSFIPDTLVPEGRPIPGAYNVLLADGSQLPVSASYSSLSLENDHSWVWNGYYLATVTGNLSEDVNGNEQLDSFEDLNGDGDITVAPSPQGAVDWGSTGYSYSRVAGGEKLREQARGNFFSADQDHKHSSPVWFTKSEKTQANLDTLGGLGLTDADPVAQLNEHRWAPLWDRLMIAKGDFQYAGDRHSPAPLLPWPFNDWLGRVLLSDLVPGWSDHGGGGEGKVIDEGIDEGGGRHVLELGDSHPSRTHNMLYVPLEAAGLEFDWQLVGPSGGGWLKIRFGDREVASLELTRTGEWQRQQIVSIPGELRGQVQTLTFEFSEISGGDGAVKPVVYVDNLRFVRGGQTGDILFVDLGAMEPGATDFRIDGIQLIDPSHPESPVAVQIERNMLRGDWKLLETTSDKKKVAGYVLFSDRFHPEGRPFSATGQLYFVPGTEDGMSTDISPEDRGFQGIVRLWVTRVENRGGMKLEITEPIDLRIFPGHSPSGSLAVVNPRSFRENVALQQRLNYWGSTDYEGKALEVDGIIARGPNRPSAVLRRRPRVPRTIGRTKRRTWMS